MMYAFPFATTSQLSIEDLAKAHGATHLGGSINWTWAEGFPTEDQAAAFDRDIQARGRETRGVYPNYPAPGLFSVRFR